MKYHQFRGEGGRRSSHSPLERDPEADTCHTSPPPPLCLAQRWPDPGRPACH